MLTAVIKDGNEARFAGCGEARLCTLGEAIAELLAGYCPTVLSCGSDVEESSIELELVGAAK